MTHAFHEQDLTAYVLGETDAAAAERIALALTTDAALRSEVDEIRATVGLVTAALAAEGPSATPTNGGPEHALDGGSGERPRRGRSIGLRRAAAAAVFVAVVTSFGYVFNQPARDMRPAHASRSEARASVRFDGFGDGAGAHDVPGRGRPAPFDAAARK